MTTREPNTFNDRCLDCDRVIPIGAIAVWHESNDGFASVGPFCDTCCPVGPRQCYCDGQVCAPCANRDRRWWR
jgi:hypothetical protein